MKRKLEDANDVFLQNPTKMLPTVAGTCSKNIVYQVVGTSPEQIGRPILASTPQGVSDVGRRQCTLPTARRIPTTTLQSNPAADNELRHVIDNFVSVYEQLDMTDNPDVKPNYSYSELAYLAMLRSPNFCLPIGQIYSYIQSRFKFFKNSTRKHWKNAVRHSLAKTLCFSKIQVGRGASNNEKLARSTYLWCILPNSIACFARGDYRATIDKESGTNTLRSAYFRMNSEPFWNSVGDYIANKMADFRKTLEESNTPGQIFESQTCLIPWKQENTQSENRPPKHREVFQRMQNQPHVTLNIQSRNCEFTQSSASSTGYYVTHSPDTGLPPAHSQVSPNLHSYHTQTRSSSPIMRIPEIQPHIQSSFGHRTTPPRAADPWLPEFVVSSPEPSFICSGQDRRTPPCTSYSCTDSGYADSTNNNSCSFVNNCEKQNHDIYSTSPLNVHEQYTANQLSNNQYDFNQFDLSPFSLSDFSDSRESVEQLNFTPEKASKSHVLSQTPHCAGQRMYVSTPIADQVPPASQCRYMYQPSIQTQNYGQRITPTPPVLFVNGDGMFSTAILPHWASFC
ncbi:uncharacterized protein LOC123541496 [Mercenaria mercenaria]|uniref:uncharacterized protein LOC123541496 n=1 Tax=Mercenaria mercenaria TaxID=6596 RepID=UPI00234EC502|nr:uncharacterized protein LOC123541496 [Mercenaria mercenaria]